MNLSRFVFPVLFVVLSTGCDVLNKPKPQKNVPKGTVSVKVISKSGENAPIFLGAYPTGSAKPVSSYRVKNGSVTGFLLDADKTYEFRAFPSRDGKDEPAAGVGVGSVKGVKPDADVHAQTQVTVVEIPEAGAAAAPAPGKPGAGPAKASSGPDLDIDKVGEPSKTDAPKKADAAAKGAAPDVPPAPKN